MELDYDGLPKTRGGLKKALSGDAPNLDDALLAELRSRRERLQQLIQLVNAELHRQSRSVAKAPRCRKRVVPCN